MIEELREKLSRFKDLVNEKTSRINELDKEKKIMLIGGVVIAVILCLFIFIPRGASTKEEVINNFKVAMENEDINLLSKNLKVDDKKVSEEEILPLMDYYKTKKDTILDIIKQLRAGDSSGIFTLKGDKKLFGIRYYINVNRVSVEVKTNFNSAEVTIDNKTLKSGDVLSKVIPGQYKAIYKLKTDFGDVEGEQEVVITEGSVVDINVNAGNITLYSDYKDAYVYINDKNIGKKVEEVVDFGPIPLNKEVKLYIEKEFPWGNIKSDTINVNSGGLIKISIDMVNEKLMADIDSTLNIFFNSVFDALNQEDKSLIQNSDENTKDKIYDDIFKKSLFFTNNYKISDMKLNIENSEFKYENEDYKGNIVVKINYDIYKKLLPFVKESREEMFLVGLQYKEGSWVANSIQRFNVYTNQ